MKTPKIFRVETAADTLVVSPLREVTSLAEDDVQQELEGIVANLEKPEITHLVIDFAEVSYFGSSMLEAMRMLARRLREGEGKMALCNASTVVREILHITRFDTKWPIHDSRDAALAAVHA